MDIQKTMEFILEQQAQVAANQAKFETNQARQDRRIEAIAKLMKMGTKRLLRHDEDIKSMKKTLQETIEIGKDSDARLNVLIKIVDGMVSQRPS